LQSYLVGCSSALAAQSPAPPPVPPSASQKIDKPGPPARELEEFAITSIARNSGLTPDQARAHVQLSRKLFKLTENLDAEQVPTLAGVYLDAKPATMLTILYSGDVSAIRSRIAVPPELADHVRFVPAKVPLRALIAQQQRVPALAWAEGT
jgi:hypothetical protein